MRCVIFFFCLRSGVQPLVIHVRHINYQHLVRVGGDSVVSSAGSPTWFASLFHRYRHVVCRLHFCGDGLQRSTFVPRRLGDRPNFQDFQVSRCFI